MPLIILTGFPSSGKTKRGAELAEFFRKRGKTVHVASENVAIPKAGFAKNEYFADSQKEKIVRSDLKSEAVRLLTKDNVVILDAGNYIKGKRLNSSQFLTDSFNGIFSFLQAIGMNCIAPAKPLDQHSAPYFVPFRKKKRGILMRKEVPPMLLNPAKVTIQRCRTHGKFSMHSHFDTKNR